MASGHVNRKIALISFNFQAGSERNPRLTERVRRGAGLGRNERAAPMLWISAPRARTTHGNPPEEGKEVVF
jgi:hypothetical protein